MEKAPVMILFFNRPDNLKEVFDAVRKYQPSELFLVQDGEREGRLDDYENVQKCRDIVANIDWKCKVRRNYSEHNLSCDYREYTGIDWCFSFVDRLIILEDDCVPSQSFFTLCEECLEKYKDDCSIHSISGFNRVGQYDSPYDYVFSVTGAGWGWATWKRVWKIIDQQKDLQILDDTTAVNYLKKTIDNRITSVYGDFVSYMQETKKLNHASGTITSWEKLAGFALIVNNMMTITPSKNMVKYIGISENATHTASDPRLLPFKVRRVLTQPSFELDESIHHPPFKIRDIQFETKSIKAMEYPPFVAKIEVGLRKFWFKVLRKR